MAVKLNISFCFVLFLIFVCLFVCLFVFFFTLINLSIITSTCKTQNNICLKMRTVGLNKKKYNRVNRWPPSKKVGYEVRAVDCLTGIFKLNERYIYIQLQNRFCT